MALIKNLVNSYLNSRSFHTNRKILVIESDDWGSRRTDNSKIRFDLNKIGSKVQNDAYIQFDNLENKDDLQALCNTLSSVKNGIGQSPILTANYCMANPDFENIRNDSFQKFHFEPFWETIGNRFDGTITLKFLKEAIEKQLIRPQLHGREHLHALAWLKELQSGNSDLIRAFDLNTWGIRYKSRNFTRRENLQAALDSYHLEGERAFQSQWIRDSAKMFESYFGFKSESFIPPAYIWHNFICETLLQNDIRAIQGIKLHYHPNKSKSLYRRIPRYTGQKKGNIISLVRNVFFEPTLLPNENWEDKTLSGIENAFNNNQPAVLGSHRINFIGSLEQANRTENNRTLRIILTRALKKWPDMEFMSSSELLELIQK